MYKFCKCLCLATATSLNLSGCRDSIRFRSPVGADLELRACDVAPGRAAVLILANGVYGINKRKPEGFS